LHLGDTNGTIVYNLATDIIRNSFGQDYIAFSPEISETLRKLKQFNYERIYFHPTVRRYTDNVRNLFRMLFDRYLEDIHRESHDSAIFSGFLKDMSQEYLSEHKTEEIVRDFIAGMTDHYFLRQCPEEFSRYFQ
jgi:dGTPase